MKLRTHPAIHQSELSEIYEINHKLSGQLSTVFFAIKQQALLQREVAKLVNQLGPAERVELERMVATNPTLRRILHKTGVSRIVIGRRRIAKLHTHSGHVSYGEPTKVREKMIADTVQKPEHHFSLEIKVTSSDDVPIPEYLSTKTVADILGVSPQMVRRYCQDGHIKATRTLGLMGDWRIDPQAFLDQDPSRYVKLQKLLKERADRNTQLAGVAEKLADSEDFSSILDGIDETRKEMDRRDSFRLCGLYPQDMRREFAKQVRIQFP